MRKVYAVLYYAAIGLAAVAFGLLFNVMVPDDEPLEVVYFIGSDV